MRVTFNMQSMKYTQSIGDSLAAVSSAQDRVNLKRNLLNPEDDASAYVAAYNIQRMLSDLKQFASNGKTASAWLTSADNALKEAMDLISSAKNDFAIGGSSSSNNAESRAAMAEKVLNIYDSLMDIANSSHMGRYLFSGFSTNTKPFDQGANQVYGVTSLNKNGGDVSAKNVYSDLPELKGGKYSARITVENGVGKLELFDDHGNKVILDSNGSDESGDKGNNSTNVLTFEYKPGAVINTGRGISIKLPNTEESALNMSFSYNAGSEMNYAGDMGSILTQIGYNQDVALNIPGGNIFSQSYKTLMGTRFNTTNGMPAALTTYFSQLDKTNSSIGDSIKLSGTDHSGNPVGSATLLSPINPKLNLANASEKERTLTVGYGDKLYKVVVPQASYKTTDDLALAINNQLKNAEYLGTVDMPAGGFDDIDHYASRVDKQLKSGKYEGEVSQADKEKYTVDLSGEIKISTDGGRLQFGTTKTGDSVRLTVSGGDRNMLGFNNMTVGGSGKDTIFELGYDFSTTKATNIKTTHENMDLTGTDFTFFINGKMVSVSKPASVITAEPQLTGQTFPTNPTDPDYIINVKGKEIKIPAADLAGKNDADTLSTINQAIKDAGLSGEAQITAVNRAAGTLDMTTATPSQKEIEFEFDKALRAAGLNFTVGASLEPTGTLGQYDLSFMMNNINNDKDTQLSSTWYNTGTVPPSSQMETAAPKRDGLNITKEKNIGDLANFIKNLYNDSVDVSLDNGKLVVKDQRSGESKMTVNIKPQNQGVGHPNDQTTVMGGIYSGIADDKWQVNVTSTLTVSGQRDVRVVIKDKAGNEIYNRNTENYLGGNITLPYGVTINPYDMGIPDPANPGIREKTSEFNLELTANTGLSFGDMNVTENGDNVNIFRSLQNLANALKHNISKNGFGEPSAWKDSTLSSTAKPFFDGKFQGMFNDLWNYEILQNNGKNDVYLQNEYKTSTGEVRYDAALMGKLGSNLDFGVDVYDNVTGASKRVDVSLDISKAKPPVTDTASLQKFILKELNSNKSLTDAGVRFTENGGKIEMQSGSGTKIATFANTATGSGRELTSLFLGLGAAKNSPLGEFPMTMANASTIHVSDPESNPVTNGNYPLTNIIVPAGTYNTEEDLLAAVNVELAKATPDGTDGRITATLDGTGGLQFVKQDGTTTETSIDAGADNPLNIAMEVGAGGVMDTFATAAQKPKTDLSTLSDEARTLSFTYTTGAPPRQEKLMITLDKKPYDSVFDLADAVNQQLAAKGMASSDMKAVISADGKLSFTGSSGNIGNLTVQGDHDGSLGFPKAGDEARIKITGTDGSVIQETVISTANQSTYISDGLYLGFDKGSLVATDSFSGAVGSGIENEIDILDIAEKQILSAQTLTGNRGSTVESVAKFQDTIAAANEKMKAEYLQSTDLDQIKAMTELTMAQNAYKSALSVSGTILSISILDFLR